MKHFRILRECLGNTSELTKASCDGSNFNLDAADLRLKTRLFNSVFIASSRSKGEPNSIESFLLIVINCEREDGSEVFSSDIISHLETLSERPISDASLFRESTSTESDARLPPKVTSSRYAILSSDPHRKITGWRVRQKNVGSIGSPCC